MKRVLIDSENVLRVQRLDEDFYRLQNTEVDLILNYDSLFELALNLSRALQEASDETGVLETSGH